MITLSNSQTISPDNVEPQGDGSGLDADTLDNVHLANVNWSDVAMAQSDVNLSDVGQADADLDMGGNNVKNTGGVVLPVGVDQWV